MAERAKIAIVKEIEARATMCLGEHRKAIPIALDILGLAAQIEPDSDWRQARPSHLWRQSRHPPRDRRPIIDGGVPDIIKQAFAILQRDQKPRHRLGIGKAKTKGFPERRQGVQPECDLGNHA